MNSWYLTFNHETCVKHNKESYNWQNPTVLIEAGFTHVFTGNIMDYAIDMTIGDKIYIYGGQKNSQQKGLFGVGIVTDILVSKSNTDEVALAVIKLEKKGSLNEPLIPYSTNTTLFNSLRAKTDCGYYKLENHKKEQLDRLIALSS